MRVQSNLPIFGGHFVDIIVVRYLDVHPSRLLIQIPVTTTIGFKYKYIYIYHICVYIYIYPQTLCLAVATIVIRPVRKLLLVHLQVEICAV